METVGIRELKANLSKYVAMAKEGERIVITEHGQEVVQLSPLATTDYAKLFEMMRDGIIQWDGGKPKGLNPGVPIKGKPISETVLEDRERDLS
ncbi:MAG: type II toxin-antitoxin system prevent-host-death family antitoxin [Rickettsiales bacterium]|nr:type II toxin-antitoxin system prevent-host-death family antitoxin [Rickettsiales bacterium]